MKKSFKSLIITLFGRNSNEVIYFFKNDVAEDKIFKTETDFLNYIITVLNNYCSVLENDIYKFITSEDKNFWKNRKEKLNIIKLSSNNTLSKNNLNTLLYTIRLINALKESNNIVGGLDEFIKYLDEFKNDVNYIMSDNN